MSRHNRERRKEGAARAIQYEIEVFLTKKFMQDRTEENAKAKQRRYPRPPVYRNQDEPYNPQIHG